MPLSAQSEDRWRLTDPYIERLWSERLGPKATLLARRLGRLSEGGRAAHERLAEESEVWRPVRAVPGAEGSGQSAVGSSASLGLAACVVKADRVRSGRRTLFTTVQTSPSRILSDRASDSDAAGGTIRFGGDCCPVRRQLLGGRRTDPGCDPPGSVGRAGRSRGFVLWRLDRRTGPVARSGCCVP
jgi:hypothetical protein